MIRFFLFTFGQFLIDVLPLKFSFRCAIFICDVKYRFSRVDREAVKNNLRCVLSSCAEVDMAAREMFRNFGRYIVEFFLIRHQIDADYVDKHVDVRGYKKFEEVIAYGRGGIFVTAHLGNWELGGVCLSLLGYPVHAVALPHQEKMVNRFFNEQRARKGIKVIPSHMAIRKCMQVLKQKKFIALVGDRDFSGAGQVMDFLGKKALVPKGAAALAVKMQVPIIPVFFTRSAPGQFCLHFCDPIYPESQSKVKNEAELITKMMKKIVCVIEDMIRKYPMQWMMFREFWV